MKLTLEGDAAEILAVLATPRSEQLFVTQGGVSMSVAEFLSRLAEMYKTVKEDDPHDIQP